VETGAQAWILLIGDRQAVRRRVARLLLAAGFLVRVTSTIAEAISVVVLERPTLVVFDSHLAAIEGDGIHAVNALLRLLETYDLPAVDFVARSEANDDGLEGAGRPAPLRPKPGLPYLRAEAELPDESVG
jgi:CheY-like chemotaxis protein